MRIPVHAVAIAVLLLTSCSGAPAGSSVTSASAAAASQAPPASASAQPSLVAGRPYQYTLTWPAEETNGEWQFATAAWDGESRVDSGNQYTDLLQVDDGRLFAFGVPTDEGPQELRGMVAEQAERWHGCDRDPTVEEALIGGGAEGIYGEYTCGGSTVLRWFGVHEGFGLFIGLIVGTDAEVDEASARFKEQVGELEWTN